MPITTAGTAYFFATTEFASPDACQLANTLEALPGVRAVQTEGTCRAGIVRFTVRGTDKGKCLALEVATIARIFNTDPNADHDHERCIASAKAMGVPAAWAHTPETYLSM